VDDFSSYHGSLLLFLFLALASGLLSGTRNVLSHFQRQFTSLHFNRSERTTEAHLIEMSYQAWQKPGFFESLSLGRYLFDLLAGYNGLFFFHSLGLGWSVSVGLTLGLGYTLAHWLLPLLSQIFAFKLGAIALNIHAFYRLLFMGAVGEGFAKMNEALMRKLGFDPKLSFLGKDQIQQFGGILPEDEHSDRSGLKEDEKEMIRSIFDLRETQAKEIMTPRVDVVALELKASWQEVMDCFTHEKFSRIPVYEGDMDHVRGILHVVDLMGLDHRGPPENFHLSEFLREAYFIPRTKKIGDLMREFRLQHVHMAMVVDEYGGTAGIITLEDILEEIVGEIHDEDEIEDTKIQALGEGLYNIDPIVSLDEIHKELEIDLRPDDDEVEIDTLGGFVLYVNGKVPDQGDIIRHRNLVFEIMEMNGQKMEMLRLKIDGQREKTNFEKTALEKINPEQAAQV
jgi:putative hemolysin